ncbi:hypothetical protein M5K25_026361 [Dendrobium thyrsiflorum]|uniref:Uncharacterized protein n=1 Tax=Dendrobium thyrsiflorum TaxID=117978 RepID=A0ABD0TX84_DENTH
MGKLAGKGTTVKSQENDDQAETTRDGGKEFRWEEFDKESFFHQELPTRAPIRGGLGVPYGGTVRREFYRRGGRVADHYGRHFGQGEWAIGERGGQEPPPTAPIRGGITFSDGGKAGREFCGGGGRVVDYYGRHFEQKKWAIKGGGQEPPSRAPIRGRIWFSDGRTAGKEFRGEGGGVADHYGRSFGQGE